MNRGPRTSALARLGLSAGIVLSCAAASAWAAAPPAVTVGGLRAEYKENPLGIDARKPRFSWQISVPPGAA